MRLYYLKYWSILSGETKIKGVPMHTLLQQTTKVILTINHTLNPWLERAGGLTDICLLSARLLMGLFFVYFGMDKLMHYSDTTIYMATMGVPGLFLPLVLVIEIGGGIALILGWRLRMVAGILAAFTLLTTLIFHTDFSVHVQLILFMKNLAILAGLLLMLGLTPSRPVKVRGKAAKR